MDPQAIGAIYASDVVSNFDIHKPEILADIFKRFGDQGAPDYFTTLLGLGFEKDVALDEYGHFEENKYHVKFRVLNVAGPGLAGASVNVTLHPDSVDANNRFYPRLNQIVTIPGGRQARISNVDVSAPTAPVLTLMPNGAATIIPQIPAGGYLVISSNAWTEGSGQPTAALSGVVYYENVAQIIKETIGKTGSEMVNQTWVRLNGMENAPYYYKGQAEMDYRMAIQIDGALLHGELTTNPNAVDADGYAYKTTEGLLPYMGRKAAQKTVAANTFPLADFDDIDKIQDANFAGNHVMAMLGIDRANAIENELFDKFKETSINYAQEVVNEQLFGGNKSMAMSINFKLLTKAERTFAFKRYKSFNHPELYGAEGYDYNQYGMFIPLNKRRDAKDKSTLVESIGMRYRRLGSYNRKSEVWQVGGAGNGIKVNEFDKTNTFQRCHIGAHFRGGEQMVLVKAA